MLTRDEYRTIKNMSREEMSKWIRYHNSMMSTKIQSDYQQIYDRELSNAIQNFIIAIVYTLHYNEDLHLQHDELDSFMDDLFYSVDYFRTGEYKPGDYVEQLKGDGIFIPNYDYQKLYTEYGEFIEKQYIPYVNRNNKAIEWINNKISTGNTDINLSDLQELQNILGGENA